ncbi:MAG: hypothetical protein MJK04_26330 [Psychrosphaera sp.]|nr:hypothetical protein [Psychrosphaera sp.]
MNHSTFNDDNDNTPNGKTAQQQSNIAACVNNKTNKQKGDGYFGYSDIVDGVTACYVLGYN